MPHRRAGRPCRRVFALWPSRHLLQFVPQPALSAVPEQRARPLAPRAAFRTAGHTLYPRRFHAPARTGAAGSAKQGGDVWPAIPLQCRDAARGRQRPPSTSALRSDFQRPAHLESETAASSPCSLRRCGRWSIVGSHTLGSSPAQQLLRPGSSSQQSLPWQVRRSREADLRGGKASVLRTTPVPGAAQSLPQFSPPALPLPLGGLLQTTLRRAPPGPPLFGGIHSSCRHLQSPTGFTARRPGYFSLERLRSQEQETAHDAPCRFLRRFLLHVLPRGLVRIRHYGFLSSRRRRELVPLCKQLLGAVVPTPTPTGTPAPAESNPMWISPLCGGPMIVIERLTAGQITLRSPPQAKAP